MGGNNFNVFNPTCLKDFVRSYQAAGHPRSKGPDDLVGLPQFDVKDVHNDADRIFAFTGKENLTVLSVWSAEAPHVLFEQIDLDADGSHDRVYQFECR